MEDLQEKVARCEDRRYQDWSESWKEKVQSRESCQSFLHITYRKLTLHDDHAHGGSQDQQVCLFTKQLTDLWAGHQSPVAFENYAIYKLYNIWNNDVVIVWYLNEFYAMPYPSPGAVMLKGPLCLTPVKQVKNSWNHAESHNPGILNVGHQSVSLTSNYSKNFHERLHHPHTCQVWGWCILKLRFQCDALSPMDKSAALCCCGVCC